MAFSETPFIRHVFTVHIRLSRLRDGYSPPEPRSPRYLTRFGLRGVRNEGLALVSEGESPASFGPGKRSPERDRSSHDFTGQHY